MFELNENSTLVIIGLVYSVLSICVFPVYIPIIYALCMKKELNGNISYKLINMLSICDILQSFVHFSSGIFICFPRFAMEIDPIVRIMGYTANVLWLASFILIAVLSLTRLGVVFFSLDSTKWTVWMKILLSIGFLYILAIWIIGCVTLNFYLSGPSWTYDMNAPFTDILPQMELYLCFPILLLSFISSILILGSIYKKKRQVLASSSLRIEIGILIQVTVLTVYMATLIIFWHNAEKWFEMSDITLSFLNVSWILFAHLNSFLLITTNRSIRQEFLKMIRRLSNPITLKISSSFSQR